MNKEEGLLKSKVHAARIEGENLIELENFTNERHVELDMSSIDFEHIRFYQCRFESCNFMKSSFRSVEFEDCDFSNCKFLDSYWNQVAIKGTKGDGGDFSESHFKFVVMENTIMRYSNFARGVFENCQIQDCQFQEAFLSEVKFKKTTISEVNFTSADFYKTKLKGLDLSTSNIEGILLSDGFPELKDATINMFQAAEIVGKLGIRVIW